MFWKVEVGRNVGYIYVFGTPLIRTIGIGNPSN